MGEVPGLQIVIEEAVDAGIETVIVVNHPSKAAVERYFEPSSELILQLEKAGKDDLAARLERLDQLDVRFVHQAEPLGLGHAVGMAAELVGDEPFAVLLPDEVMGSSELLSAMLDASADHGGSVVGLKEVPHERVSSYGVVAPAGPMRAGGLLPVGDLVETPPVDEAPSDYVIIGRYVCTPSVMTEIAQLEPGAGGELQLTDALRAVARYEPFFGVVGDELPGGLVRYDTGNPAGWLEAVVEIALRDPKLGPGLRDQIVRMVEREGFLAGA